MRSCHTCVVVQLRFVCHSLPLGCSLGLLTACYKQAGSSNQYYCPVIQPTSYAGIHLGPLCHPCRPPLPSSLPCRFSLLFWMENEGEGFSCIYFFPPQPSAMQGSFLQSSLGKPDWIPEEMRARLRTLHDCESQELHIITFAHTWPPASNQKF